MTTTNGRRSMVRLVQTRPPSHRKATFVSLATAVLLLGVADSMVGSYAVLFASGEVGLTPLQVGVFVSAPAMGGIVVSWLLGRRFDQRPTRRYAAVVTALGALGLLLVTRTSSFAVLVLLALTLLGGLTAAFPQLFALARIVAGGGPAAERSAPLLRSAWSLAWAIGPLIGAVLLTRTSFAAILAAAAGVLAVTSAVVLTVPPPGGTHAASVEAPPEPPPSSRSSRLRLALLTSSVALFFTAMFAGSVALPLFVTRSLHSWWVRSPVAWRSPLSEPPGSASSRTSWRPQRDERRRSSRTRPRPGRSSRARSPAPRSGSSGRPRRCSCVAWWPRSPSPSSAPAAVTLPPVPHRGRARQIESDHGVCLAREMSTRCVSRAIVSGGTPRARSRRLSAVGVAAYSRRCGAAGRGAGTGHPTAPSRSRAGTGHRVAGGGRGSGCRAGSAFPSGIRAELAGVRCVHPFG